MTRGVSGAGGGPALGGAVVGATVVGAAREVEEAAREVEEAACGSVAPGGWVDAAEAGPAGLAASLPGPEEHPASSAAPLQRLAAIAPRAVGARCVVLGAASVEATTQPATVTKVPIDSHGHAAAAGASGSSMQPRLAGEP